MGRPKIHRPKDPAAALGSMFRQVVGTVFTMMSHFESLWMRVKYSRPTAIYGFGLGEVEMPPKVEVNTRKLLEKFHEGFDLHKEILQEVLSKDVFQKILEIKHMNEKMFAFPIDLWARTLYDMAVGYRDGLFDPDRMMEALIPLYFGRTLAFVRKTSSMSTQQAEEAVEECCLVFEKTKPYLIQRWKGEKPSK